MYQNHAVGVVVPAHNEEGFVGDVIESIPPFVDRVFVVDDGSEDGTWEEIQSAAVRLNGDDAGDRSTGGTGAVDARGGTDDGTRTGDEAAAATHATDTRGGAGATAASRDGSSTRPDLLGSDERRVVPIRHQTNRGVGGAIKTGYRRALDGGCDVVVVMGGDGQMDPDVLPRLIEPIVAGKADYVKGNRLMDLTDPGDMPRFRFVGNVLLSVLTKIASGYWESADSQNGYTAISGAALERVDFDAMYEDYGYVNDLLIRLNEAKLRVADVPQPESYGDEESGIVYSEYVPRVSSLLLRGFLRRLTRRYVRDERHPIALLFLGSAVGVAAGLLGALRRLFPGGDRSGRSTLALGVGLLLGLATLALDRRLNAEYGVDVAESSGGTPAENGRATEKTVEVGAAPGE